MRISHRDIAVESGRNAELDPILRWIAFTLRQIPDGGSDALVSVKSGCARWCADRGAEPLRPHLCVSHAHPQLLHAPRLARRCCQTLFAGGSMFHRSRTAPTSPPVSPARGSEVRLPKQRRNPVTRLPSHRSACPVTHGVASKTCGSAPSLEGNTCVYDAPTTPRSRRCDEAGNTFPRRASDPTFPA